MVCACLEFSVSSSSWGLGRAAVCDYDTSWTFLLPSFYSTDRSKAGVPCWSYSSLLCGLFYEAICFMSYLVLFCSCVVFFSALLALQ